jgi:hypothetical protein
MADDDATPPRSNGGRSAVLSFHVTGPRDAAVVVAVEHRDPGETWLPAGSVSMIAPSESSLRVGGLKKEFRFRVSGDPAQVHVLPPEWLPY